MKTVGWNRRLGYAMPHAIFGASHHRRSHAGGDYRNREGSVCKSGRGHVAERFTDVSIYDGIKSYSIDEFASVMALQEIANTVESAATPALKAEGKSLAD